MKLRIRVIEIKGKCPVYHLGDSIILRQGYILDPENTDPVCMHALASIFPYYVALSRGVKAKDLGKKFASDMYRKTSSVWSMIIFESDATLIRTSFRIWSSGKQCLCLMVGEQNWHPRPQPLMISTVP